MSHQSYKCMDFLSPLPTELDIRSDAPKSVDAYPPGWTSLAYARQTGGYPR